MDDDGWLDSNWIAQPVVPGHHDHDTRRWSIIDGGDMGVISAVISADGEVLLTEAHPPF